MTAQCSPRWLRWLLLGSAAKLAFVLPTSVTPGYSRSPSLRAGRLDRSDQFEAGDGSGRVVSKILETGVRLLLRRYDMVRVKVQSRWDQLIRGRVEAVELSGKQWCTKLRLRARSLVVSASCAALDYGELLQGRVTLTEVAKGSAKAIFDAQEFGDFLIYPQVSEAAPVVSGAKVLFSERGVEIDSSAEQLTFQGRHAGQAFRARLTCGDGGKRPKVSLHSDARLAEATKLELETALETFFSKLQIDLAGVLLRFDRLNFPRCDAVAVLLTAEIRRIPNPFRDVI